MSSSYLVLLALVIFSAAAGSHVEAKINTPPLAKGLSWSFHDANCPNLEGIIRTELIKVFQKDIGQAAGLLRLHFHDCFVQGCDGSILLDGGSASEPSEKDQLPNQTLRPQSFKIINDLRSHIHKACGHVVSCADITALAARDAVYLSGGPMYQVPLGRRDGLTFATENATLESMAPPFSNTSALITALAAKNLDTTDLVALSGAHTIGIVHCASFAYRALYYFNSSRMDKTLAENIKLTCPEFNTTNTTTLDIRSPNVFDNKYYVDLMNRQGLLNSDQDLYMDARTKPIVTSFAEDQNLFFEKFVYSMIKMGQLDVLTGDQGQIRANCSAPNPTTSSYLSSAVEEEDHQDINSASY